MTITIYHNPACGTSRKVLELLRSNGHEPQVIEYLKTPPSREELKNLITRSEMSVRDVLRQNAPPYAELGLDRDTWNDDELLDVMIKEPILINRPIVSTPQGVRLCRPPEKLGEILTLAA